MSGTLPLQLFLAQAERFCKLSDLLNDGWKLIDYANSYSQRLKLLRKQVVRPFNISDASYLDIDTDVGNSIHANNDEYDAGDELFLTLVYDVIYSDSYSVPVLYFTAHHVDGQMVPYKHISNIFSSLHCHAMMNQFWNCVTQAGHPVSHTPTYMLHPCKTSAMMSSVTSNAANIQDSFYLLQWLSTTGSMVNLDIPVDYLKLLSNHSL